MGKSTRGDREYSRLQEVIHENKRLKRELSSLRKQLTRIDLDRHAYVKEIIDEHYAKEDQEETTGKMLKRLKEEWKCRKCHDGFLEIRIYTKINEAYYFRQCNNCSNRTKSQKYVPDRVIGIIKNSSK